MSKFNREVSYLRVTADQVKGKRLHAALHQGLDRIDREYAELEADAARWRSLMACERIRFVGGSFKASPREPDALVGFDFHRKHPEQDDSRESRQILLDFVDGEILGGEKP